MTLFLDTEFSGHGPSGDLLSLAVASQDNYHWYGVLPLPETVHPWVAENVVPKLGALPSGARFKHVVASDVAEFRAALIDYLRYHQGATIVADWPGDFRHLLALFEGPTFAESWCPRFKFQLINTPDGEPKPEIPHNALSDAIALMRWHENQS